jgi:acetyl esterase
VLFNPVLDFPDLLKHLPADRVAQFSDLGDRAVEISPIHHVRAGTAPTIIFHGTVDTTVPFEQATRFCDAMKKQGNYCEVVPFIGRPHGFFAYGKGDNANYWATLRKTDEILISLEYLKRKPTIK